MTWILMLLLVSPGFLLGAGDAFELQVTGTEMRDGIEVRDITFRGAAGGRTSAYLVVPPGKGPFAGILYVHWYEPPDPTSNRTEYVNEAVALAKRGVVSLLPATMWSDFEWFQKRKREDDLKNSLQQVAELRRALDVLLAQAGIERKRVAYVGHDFGAMFGAVMAGMDGRPSAYALQAGTPKFSNWYLYGPPMPEPARTEFIRSLAQIDPVRHIAKAAPAPVLFQFATHDIFVSQDEAVQFYDAARQPKEIIFYDTVHKMNARAEEDRVGWLSRVLKVGSLAERSQF